MKEAKLIMSVTASLATYAPDLIHESVYKATAGASLQAPWSEVYTAMAPADTACAGLVSHWRRVELEMENGI